MSFNLFPKHCTHQFDEEELDEIFDDMESKDDEYLLVITKMEALKEEIEGVTETLDEIPADIAKKWLEDLNQINAEYLEVKGLLVKAVMDRQSEVLKYLT